MSGPAPGDESDSRETPASLTTRTAKTAVTVLLVALLIIPARLVVGPLGGAGSPAQMLGVAMAVWWFLSRVASFGSREPFNPVARAALLVLASVGASYVAANIRWTTALEASAAQRGVISAVALCGMALFAAEKIGRRADLDSLIRQFVLIVAGLGVFGLVQFVTRERFIEYISIPGLTANSDISSLEARGPFLRPAATLVHPIEYGAVLTMALPLALHLALHGGERGRIHRWWPTVSIALAIPMALTRSAILSAAVALVILLPTWPRTWRRRAYAVLVVGTLSLNVLVPGLVGTLRGMFSTIVDDPSANSRTDSYSAAFEFISRAPVFGRGFRTFMPDYRILDNQYLLSAIETGLVGLATLIVLIATAIGCAVLARRRTSDASTRDLAIALAAAMASAASGIALFDQFSFMAAAGCLFVLAGFCGALYRFAPPRPEPGGRADVVAATGARHRATP
jgi:polysaccharide biosynthesis protein PslJ